MIGSSSRGWWGRRVLWAAAAQTVSSATNFVLYLGLLWFASTVEFGRWVAVLAVYHLVVALARSLVSEPLVAAGPPSTGPASTFSWAWARRRYRRLGLGAAAAAAVVGLVVGADRGLVVAVVLVIPLLVGQDGARHRAWAHGRPAAAVVLDAVWLLVTVGTAAGLAAAGWADAESMVTSWLLGGVASWLTATGLVAPRLLRVGDPAGRPDRRADSAGPEVPAQPAEHRLHDRRRSHALLTLFRNLLPLAVALALGPAAAGLLKAALVPFTPLLSLVAGLRVVVLPAMQRAAAADAAGRLDRFVGRLVLAYLVGAGLVAAATVALVDAGQRWLGGLEAIRIDLVGWGAVVAVTICVAAPLADAIGFGRRSVPVLRWRLVEIAIEWSAVFVAVAVAGADGAVIGWAMGVALGTILWIVIGLVPDTPADLGRPLARPAT